MFSKTIQKIRVKIVFIFYILIYFFLIETIFFLTHLISRNFWWIFVSEDVGNFEKIQVEEVLSFPPLEVGSLKAKRLEISNRFIWFLLCRLHVMNLLKIVDWCKHNNNKNNTKKNWIIFLNIIYLNREITQHYLDPLHKVFKIFDTWILLHTYLAQYLRQFMLAH